MGIERMFKLVIFYNEQARRCQLLERVASYLSDKGAVVETFLIDQVQESALKPDKYTHAIALGGDGTTLRASLLVESLVIPLLAIHVGTLGFLASHEESTWQQSVDDYLRDRLSLTTRPLLSLQVGLDAQFCAVNEVVMSSVHRKLITMSLWIGESPQLRVRAEGLLVATPTGSTGTALAYGGAIISPQAGVLMVNTLGAFDLSARAMIVRDDVVIRVCFDRNQWVTVLADGREQEIEVKAGQECVFKLSSRKVMWAGVQEVHFYHALREKLGWFTLAAGVKQC